MITELGPRVFRLGDDIVNSYLLVDGEAITVVDAGVPAYWGDLPAALTRIGRSLADVKAVLLTHGHSDHIGFAELARRAGVPVWVHELDAALARSEVANPARGLGPSRVRPLVSFLWWTMRHGGLRVPKLASVDTFGDGATLDVPGSPRAILVPGHTPGSAALHFGDHAALCVGDALATYAVTTGQVGPQIAPFTADPVTALASLSRIEDLAAELVLPGHGAEWRGGVHDAVRRVRETAALATTASRG
ncbi:MAG TPA: MBL fold metallo-hydrolase [Candidatus Limnocylindrales bacterium]|nr:MBL fold metallo-hydrolase [Candidatus Limnocylindrales bacterium]